MVDPLLPELPWRSSAEIFPGASKIESCSRNLELGCSGGLAGRQIPLGSKGPKCRVSMVSKLGIVMMVLGRYLILVYLDPQGEQQVRGFKWPKGSRA